MRFVIVLIILLSLQAFAEVRFLPAKTDAARVEALAPLTEADRASISVAVLKTWTQEQLDQLYFRLESGPFPMGDFKGTILVKNSLVQQIEGKLLESFMGRGLFKGLVRDAVMKALCRGQDGLECVGEYFWKGKRFYAQSADGALEARNAVPLWVRNPVALKLAGLGTLVAPLAKARLEKFDGSDFMMLFPANVYCGISLIDARRESIVIDYAHGDDFSPYIPEVDSIAGRDGKGIRDEIRMIRPGLYLGRAYTDKLFVLNFVLEAKGAPSQDSRNRCWSGSSWN